MVYLSNGFRTFNTVNMGSVGQRAAKLLAVNVGGLKKSLPTGPGPTQSSRPGFEPWLTGSSGAGAGWQTFFETSDIDS